MRIITFNANGIRSAANKGFFDWLRKQSADVVCLQETKSQEDQLTDPMFRPDGHHCFYRDATSKKGYSGVAIYSQARAGRGAHDARLEAVRQRGPLHRGALRKAQRRVALCALGFVRRGTAALQVQGDEVVQAGARWLARERSRLRASAATGTSCAVVSTSSNWTSNQKNSGCLPAERDWLNGLCDGDAGWVDTYRTLNPDGEDYTWWSNRGAARAKNVGWRIDYQMVTPSLRAKLKGWSIAPSTPRFSDHAPYTVDYA